MTGPTARRWHPTAAHDVGGDVGGRAAGAVVKDEHRPAFWEYRVDALMTLLTARGLLNTDELRRAVESLGPGAYETMSYYERWITAIATLMIERGVVTSDELSRRMAQVEAAQVEAAQVEAAQVEAAPVEIKRGA